jgi:hypothetical protein
MFKLLCNFHCQAGAVRRFKPLFDRILIEKFLPELVGEVFSLFEEA